MVGVCEHGDRAGDFLTGWITFNCSRWLCVVELVNSYLCNWNKRNVHWRHCISYYIKLSYPLGSGALSRG